MLSFSSVLLSDSSPGRVALKVKLNLCNLSNTMLVLDRRQTCVCVHMLLMYLLEFTCRIMRKLPSNT